MLHRLTELWDVLKVSHSFIRKVKLSLLPLFGRLHRFSQSTTHDGSVLLNKPGTKTEDVYAYTYKSKGQGSISLDPSPSTEKEGRLSQLRAAWNRG